ncbi:MAG: tetratricopeptide repeat protein, partial [Nitrospinaceae bacterium]|nr:tetratricopeptide repeat protein [Nitrospinaceae bacterium]NIR56768.1 tetratricopeptide repeat protein [Nitrospinaceae bacterium]NIS87219.1 tetratricopeptide repeat protein [Nitrospinaceae bacterium]NIT84089.1 tetratricopeptide repeat protein [Nitrospinaceae bacterium]NIU46268.1 tetratricopeptide repeat protein [Nitrospinaceae bacterium]
MSSAGTFDFDEKAKIHYQEGVRLSQNHQWKKAIEAFEKAVKLDPLHALAQANLGVAYSHLKLYKEALLAFDKALKLGYDHAGLRYNRGVSFAQVKLLEEAARELETALKMNPRMVKADYDLGVVYNLMGKNQKAREQVNKLYRRNYPLAKKLHEQIPPPYTVISVDDGGTLKGRVTLQGPIPKPRSFHLIHSPNIEFCSRISDGKGHRLLFDFSVSETRG